MHWIIINKQIWLDQRAAYAALALFSLAVGSLLNVVIHRLPLMLQATWQAECRHLLDQSKTIEAEKTPPINLFFPRSFCPQCKQPIRAWQNIPIISFFMLRGRCYHCRCVISWQYPFIEALCMGLSLLAAVLMGFHMQLLFACCFIWLVIPLCFIDLQHQLLPDGLTLSLLWAGLIANTNSLFSTLPDAVIGAAVAYVSLWLLIKFFFLLTGKIGMGQGDFKLFAALGAWFGWAQLPFILILSSLAGSLIGFIYLKARGQSIRTAIPFGPFLCLSGLIVLFFYTTHGMIGYSF